MSDGVALGSRPLSRDLPRTVTRDYRHPRCERAPADHGLSQGRRSHGAAGEQNVHARLGEGTLVLAYIML